MNELLEKGGGVPDAGGPLWAQRGRQGYRDPVTATLPRPPATSRSICRGSKGVSFGNRHHQGGIAARESSVEEALIRDVHGRRFRAPCGGHHGGTVGQQGLACHHQRTEQKSLRSHRGLAQPLLQGGRYPYVYVDGIYLRRNWGGNYENISCLVAIAVNEDSFREVWVPLRE